MRKNKYVHPYTQLYKMNAEVAFLAGSNDPIVTPKVAVEPPIDGGSEEIEGE